MPFSKGRFYSAKCSLQYIGALDLFPNEIVPSKLPNILFKTHFKEALRLKYEFKFYIRKFSVEWIQY